MLKRMLGIGLFWSLFYVQTGFSESAPSVPPSGSHFNLTVSGATLTITTKTRNRTYPNAGIQILTPGFTVSGNVRSTNDGFYLFSVSDTSAANLLMIGSGGAMTIKICLDGVGQKYSCEKHNLSGFANTHFIFSTSNSFTGDLGGTAGADAICQAAAYSIGSRITVPGLTFKALIVTSTRYPCSSKNGGVSGSCGGSFASDWPLVPSTPYVNSRGGLFNTVNQNGVFDGANSLIPNEMDNFSFGQQFWTGIQSVLSNASGNDVVGWAYSDMNVGADGAVYATNLGNCADFTSSSGLINGSFGTLGQDAASGGGASIAPSTWGNYFYFNDSQNSAIANVFITPGLFFVGGPVFLAPIPCNAPQPIVCVS